MSIRQTDLTSTIFDTRAQDLRIILESAVRRLTLWSHSGCPNLSLESKIEGMVCDTSLFHLRSKAQDLRTGVAPGD